VIGGYTLPEGSRKYFGSLLVGYNSPEGLQFAGRVGTGFSEKLLASVDSQSQKIKRSTCPFINLPEKTRGRWGPRDYPCDHETLPLGRAHTGRPGQFYSLLGALWSIQTIPRASLPIILDKHWRVEREPALVILVTDTSNLHFWLSPFMAIAILKIQESWIVFLIFAIIRNAYRKRQ
jgi:hypothetical protein